MSITPGPEETAQDAKKLDGGRLKIATITSCFLWVSSIALSFAIPPTSSLIWLPDSILLTGFLPLLLVSKWSWPWVVFGVLNGLIGFLLLTVSYIPDQPPLTKEMIEVKHHLASYHPCWSWMIIGSLCTIYGILHLAVNGAIWSYRKIANKQTKP